METVIDLSKKPEGATHYAPAGDERAFRWFNMDKGQFGASWMYGRWDLLDKPSNRDDMVEIKVQWNGEGLPPVGTHVIVYDDGSLVYGQGESGEVLAHVDGCAVIRMSYGLGCFLPRCLRTPAQIEEENRIASAYAMCKIAPSLSNTDAVALYDAGYRKQVAQ